MEIERTNTQSNRDQVKKASLPGEQPTRGGVLRGLITRLTQSKGAGILTPTKENKQWER